MSCSILVDDSPANCELDYIDSGGDKTLLINGRNSPYRNRNCQQQSIFHFFTFVARTIFYRRLRLLKIYMATAVIILLLFLVLKLSKSTANQLHERQPFNDATDAVQANLDDHNVGIINNYEIHTNAIHDLSSTKLRTIVKPIHHSEDTFAQATHYGVKNFSYALSSREFSQMKNINMMQVRIREAAKHSWDNYRRYAWGFDMLKPRSKEPDHWFNLGLTIVDAADTLIMMGLNHEANLAIDWMEHELKFDSRNENSNCFELTIRILAGLLSAYHLSGSEKLRLQAINFGDILLHCYDTESGIVPYSDIDLSTQRAHPPVWNPLSSLSEVTSLQLEFRFLSQISGDPKYEKITFRTSEHIHNLTENRNRKLLPMYINPNSGLLEDSIITLGARSDSYYEYLLKQYLQTGIKWLETDYLDTMDEVRDLLIRHTDGADNYTYVAEMQIYNAANNTEDVRYYNKMDHLVCFLPGTLVLGYYHFSPLASEYRLKYNLETPAEKLNSRYNGHLEMATAISRTCYHMYSNMGTGLAPEIANFVHSATNDPVEQNQPELMVQSNSAHNILRPEFVESLFYMYHITGLPVYRNQASEIFESFQKYSRIPSGYSAVSDVRTKPSASTDIDEALHKHAPDRMESFWLSETLKYLYLIFCDDKHIVGTILNNYVFNTEAHLFPLG